MIYSCFTSYEHNSIVKGGKVVDVQVVDIQELVLLCAFPYF